jgi:hypothetical protein
MVDDGATLSDVRESDIENFSGEKAQAGITSGLSQFGVNPIKNIDLTRAEASNNAKKKENRISKKVYTVKRLFIQYVNKYKSKWEVMKNYPKQIKQKPAWFDYALSLFDESEISQRDKKILNDAFIGLWEYRDRLLPERVMGEEESIRQYGVKSPYYEQPEESMETSLTLPEETEILSESTPVEYQVYSDVQQPQVVQQPEFDNTLGVRKIVPSGDSFLSGYISPIRRQTVDVTPSVKPVVRPPQGEFTMGVTQSEKLKGGSGGGAFSIGASMLSGIRGGDSLQGIINQRMPSPPSQPVAVRPAETITIAQQQAPVAQRSKKQAKPMANRKVLEVSGNLNKYRTIELPNIGKRKMPTAVIPMKKKSDMEFTTGKIKGNFNVGSTKYGKMNTGIKIDRSTLGNMSRDVKGSIGGVVGGIKTLKGQVRNEFTGGKEMKNINLKNIRSGKTKGHKDLDVLNQLKSQTKSQISRKALECKMIPKLKEQCDKVFTKNYITNEVSKFRNEFKDISKTVPTVRGEKAKLKEVAMLGNSINHGVDGVHVDDIRTMYKNSGATKQMNIGMMEYDYSFVTGKKKPRPPVEYYEEE